MKILKDIYTYFPEIDWDGLNHTSYPRIRFYFDYNEKQLPKLLIKLQKIFKNFFIHDDIFIWIILIWNKKLSNNTIKLLKERWLFWIIEHSKEKMIIKKEDNNNFYFFCKINFSEINTINKAIIEKDFWISPQLYLDCFYFNFNKWIAINLYDDRGMDIISQTNKINSLQNIYNVFHKEYKIIFEKK